MRSCSHLYRRLPAKRHHFRLSHVALPGPALPPVGGSNLCSSLRGDPGVQMGEPSDSVPGAPLQGLLLSALKPEYTPLCPRALTQVYTFNAETSLSLFVGDFSVLARKFRILRHPLRLGHTETAGLPDITADGTDRPTRLSRVVAHS